MRCAVTGFGPATWATRSLRGSPPTALGSAGGTGRSRSPPESCGSPCSATPWSSARGLEDEQTFAARLEVRLNAEAVPGARYEVLNFGISGYDTGHELRSLEHHALAFGPDVVLLHFFLNDVLYVRDYSFYPEMFQRSAREASTLRWRVRELARKSRMLMTCWDYLAALRGGPMQELVRAYLRDGEVPPEGPWADGWRFVEAGLERFRDLGRARGFKPGLVILPLPQEVADSSIRATYPGYLIERSGALGVPAIEVLPDLRTSGHKFSDLLIPYDYHLAAAGHEVVASVLARHVPPILEGRHGE